jgi:hypothetical protein
MTRMEDEKLHLKEASVKVTSENFLPVSYSYLEVTAKTFTVYDMFAS